MDSATLAEILETLKELLAVSRAPREIVEDPSGGLATSYVKEDAK